MSAAQIADYLDNGTAEQARQDVHDVLRIHAEAGPATAHNLVRENARQFLSNLEREIRRSGVPGHLAKPMLAAVDASLAWFGNNWNWAYDEGTADPQTVAKQALATIDLYEFWAKDAAAVEIEAKELAS